MDLSRHAAVLWRFRHIVLGGVSLGIAVACLVSYSASWSGGPAFTPRGAEVWSANSSILVTQPGFPEGRVTLPQKQVGNAVTSGGQPASGKNARPSDQVEFADPARLAALADLYSRFLLSDNVLSRVRGKIKTTDVSASPFASSQGGLVLPVIQLTTNDASEYGARERNRAVFKALRTVLSERQSANRIARGRRVELKLIDAPKAVLTSGRGHTAAILAFVLCLLGGVAVAHLLAALQRDDTQKPVVAPMIAWNGEPRGEDEERAHRRSQVTTDAVSAPPPAGRR